ncbi:MAG: TSUP family transporter [Oscillospiraceae bacterium]|nr:TSUP family transporter [Oscillospiraceae bacterium]
MEGIARYLIVCPLVFLGGFVDAIAGGGGLISLPAYLIAGLPVHASIGTNKISSAMGTTLTTYRFWRKGYVRARLSLLCALFALVGSTCGANLALLVDDQIFKILLLFILPLTALYVFKSKSMETAGKEPLSPRRTACLASVIALVIGVYDGFYGPGTGTFLLLLLTGLAHMSLNDAAGTTKVINLATNIAALVTYLINGQVYLALGLTAGIFGIAGNYLGAQCFTTKGSKIVKPLIGAVLALFFVRVIYELITG